ncbi:hypothetical protein D6810_00765 [Candidatus Dojkabacteria bacterium]|uniref:Uncharacterized protein n=1 Tax=Candidatus Dojkabacteria bacterium TaxID=2099670 RepID=A0A3M0YZM9_9BACT|nr:MAG: hypothetical protein D6810_00765 [Candidatus Dojkabacteria bacterium]
MKEDKNYVRALKTKISEISDLIKLSSLSIVTIKNFYFDSEVRSTIYHICETDLGKNSFDSYLKAIIKAVLDEDANRKVDNIKFYEEEKLFFVTNDDNGKIILKEMTEENVLSFVKPNIEDYFPDFMFFPILEYDEYFLDEARFSKLKKINSIVGLGFLLTYDYKF